MTDNYYTLLKLSREFEKLIGMEIVEIILQEKGTIIFTFFDGINDFFLFFSNVFPQSAIFINNKFARSNKNCTKLFQFLYKDRLQQVELINKDRIILLKFINYSVYFTLFGGNNANIFICNKKGVVLQTLTKYNTYVNKKFEITPNDISDFTDYNKNASLLEALTKSNLRLTKQYACEFCNANKLNSDAKIENIENLQEISEHANDFINKISRSQNFYVLQDLLKNIHFSLIPLSNYTIFRTYNSINDAISFYQALKMKEAKIAAINKELFPKLNRDKMRLQKEISISKDAGIFSQLAEKYKSYAELLMSQNNLKLKYGKSISIEDWSGNVHEIKLDEKLNILENAEKYYKKVRKTLKDIEVKKKRLPVLEDKLKKIEEIEYLIKNTENLKDLSKIRNELLKKSVIVVQNEERSIETKFRKFRIGDDFLLFVGKNATNNDELTMKFAKPNDIWLHARGSSGSHCVIKRENGEKMPEKLPKHILQAAAQIAAFYSGAKNAKYTPVCYTQKKYVYKPKGANIGAVALQKEEVIMVEPKLPETNEIS